jgi:hypothetical protein
VENLFAWVPLLMGAELFGFAMTEAVKKNIVSTIWFLASSLAAFGIAVYLASPEGIPHLQRIVGVPPLGWFILLTIVVAKILCVIERWRYPKPSDKRSSASITIQTGGWRYCFGSRSSLLIKLCNRLALTSPFAVRCRNPRHLTKAAKFIE